MAHAIYRVCRARHVRLDGEGARLVGGRWNSPVRQKGVLRLYIQMQYEWDESKNRLNQRKHGISFEVAALAFEDERCLVRLDRIDEAGEQRWHAIGAARIEPDAAVVLLVVHVYREETNGEETIRIISARRAEKNDLRRYQEQKME
jgi:hypothetical protein